ncbi:glycosyltransferase family 4 protein [Actinoplanes sp. NPDC000266]
MRLRIGVDGRVLDDRYHGIGRVMYGLCGELARLEGVELVVFTGRTRSERFDVDRLAERPNVTLHPVGLPPVDVRQLWRWRGVLRRRPVDVMFFPYHLGATPFAGVPSLAMVHDCIFEADPRFAPSRSVLLSYRLLTTLITRTTTALTVSRASADQIAERYRRTAHVIPNGVDLPPPPSCGLATEYGIEPGYVLHVGAQRPHKNAVVLVEAIAKVPAARLVLIGSPDPRFPDEVGPAIDRLGVADRVLRLPFVPEELLGAVYADAALLAYPSLAEGFGLPVLEAMTAGTPVVASDVPVLREVGGAAATYVPPRDSAAWASAIARLLADPALRESLAARGAAHAAGFTWAAAAERLLEACVQAVRR